MKREQERTGIKPWVCAIIAGYLGYRLSIFTELGGYLDIFLFGAVTGALMGLLVGLFAESIRDDDLFFENIVGGIVGGLSVIIFTYYMEPEDVMEQSSVEGIIGVNLIFGVPAVIGLLIGAPCRGTVSSFLFSFLLVAGLFEFILVPADLIHYPSDYALPVFKTPVFSPIAFALMGYRMGAMTNRTARQRKEEIIRSTGDLITETRSQLKLGTGAANSLLQEAEDARRSTRIRAARHLSLKASEQVSEENVVYERIKELANEIARSKKGANPERARELHDRALEELEKGNYDIGNLIEEGFLAANPTTEYLLGEGIKLMNLASKSYEHRKYGSAIGHWKEAMAIYEEAKGLIKGREENELMEKVTERIGAISRYISQAENEKTVNIVLNKTQNGNRLVNEANRKFDSRSFNAALETYGKAKQKFNEALGIALKHGLEDAEKIEEEIRRIEEAEDASKLSIAQKRLEDKKKLVRTSPASARRALLKIEKNLESMEVKDGKALEELKNDTRRHITIAGIEQGRSDLEKAEKLFDTYEFYQSKEKYKAIRGRLEEIADGCVKYGFADIKGDVDPLIDRCNRNIRSCTDVLLGGGKVVWREPVEPIAVTAPSAKFRGERSEISVPAQQPPPGAFGSPGEIGVGNYAQYEIIELIGKGNFAEVHKARHKETGSIVAIKKPRIQGTIDESVYRKFLKEAKLWYGLSQKGIAGVVKVFGYGVKPFPWIAMEYMAGGCLAERVREPDHRESSRIIVHLLETMNKVNRFSGAIHRDLKPENILFTENGFPKIADWGLGKYLMDNSLSMGFKGTPYYSAPEQFDEKMFGKISWKTDLYQIGAVYYELLTGRKPFPHDGLTELMFNIINKDPDLPSKAKPGVPIGFDRILMKALRKRQEDRYEFMEMAREIRKVIG